MRINLSSVNAYSACKRKFLLFTHGIFYFCKPVNQDGLLVCDRQEQCLQTTCKQIIDHRSHIILSSVQFLKKNCNYQQLGDGTKDNSYKFSGTWVGDESSNDWGEIGESRPSID